LGEDAAGQEKLNVEVEAGSLGSSSLSGELRGVVESGTSPTNPLRASTWIGYLKRLGEKAGFQYSFTQYGLRRGLLNVVNSKSARLGPTTPISLRELLQR